MKYYKDTKNNVFAYEDDGSQDHLIGDKVLMTVDEVEAHTNPPKTAEQLKAEAQAGAQAYLDSTDWVTNKYIDVVVVLQTMTREEYLAKYSDIYTKREEARITVNETEVRE